MLANASANEAKDELWAIYAWWSCVLVLKMMSLTWFTGRVRVEKQVIHSEEDRIWMLKPDVILCPTGDGHPDVIRIRSAHRKDLETILIFLVFSPLWLNIETCISTVKILIPSFSLSSIFYTILHMQLLQMPPFYKVVLSTTMFLILTYICALATVRYIFIIAEYKL
ncbi:PREDICTED: uncharacterized protein LOC106747073 [Dinoponera quadriceps]|uniref:Microsomal glutathione S-transferase 1 n=1 Tax=Dinoponera quadriceps TaxID=609295 RepID=A0A6P3XMY4_DINQU|nr:PREDICTED: uncharacterized protein LOC106747073 [Dinoponera quadriceps]